MVTVSSKTALGACGSKVESEKNNLKFKCFLYRRGKNIKKISVNEKKGL